MLVLAALPLTACPGQRFLPKWTEQCIESGAFEFTDCWFGDCVATEAENGGAISFTATRAEGHSIFTNCAFTRCRAPGSGGAVYDRLSTWTRFAGCCGHYCDATGGGFYAQQTYITANLTDCSFSRCSPLEGAFSQCWGPGALYQCGDALVLRSNFTDNRVKRAGSDIWSYFRPELVGYCIFNRGVAALAMIYSEYQGNHVNVSQSSFLNSTSLCFHSHGSTGGSVITARGCLFKDVGGFDCNPTDESLIFLINCDFSNATIWASGSVSVTGARVNSTRSVAVHHAVVDRECLWYADKTPLATQPRPTATGVKGEEKTILWIAVGAAGGAVAIAAIVAIACVVRGVRRLASKSRSQLNPYTE
jgi:hypothetical protein